LKHFANLSLLLVAVTWPRPALAQITWERRYGGDYNERIQDIIQPSGDLAYVAVGNTNSYGPGSPDFDNPFIMKVDYRGQVLWFRTHGAEVADGVYCVRETMTERGFVMCGYRRLEADHEVMLLIRTDPLGNLLWERTYGGDYSGFATSVTPTLDGGFLLTGYLGEDYPAYSEAILLKIAADGDVLWKRNFVFTFEGVGFRVIESVDGGLVFAGHANVGGSLQQQYFVAWLDSTGLPYRTRYYGGDGPDRLVSMERTPTGYVLVGNTPDDPPVHSWPHLVAISRTGDVLWDRILVEPLTQPVYGCRAAGDGGLILAGGMNENGARSDLYIMKTDPDGSMSWRRRYGAGGGYTDVGYGVMPTRDHGYIVGGFSSSGGPGDSIYLIKTGPDGTLGSAMIPDFPLAGSTPRASVRPNPFRSITTLPGHERKPVVLFDVGGRIVGHYEGSSIGGDLSPGVYFLQLPDVEGEPLRIVKTP
jgi:hypothetical protein